VKAPLRSLGQYDLRGVAGEQTLYTPVASSH
jgi:hypothetical protein